MSKEKGTIFITGATGYVGSVVAQFAVAEGYKVNALSRNENGDVKIKDLGATPVRGDLLSAEVLSAESGKADIVLHLADPFAGGTSGLDYAEVVRIDKAAVDAIGKGLEGTDKPFVCTSGVLVVSPDANGAETTEDAAPWDKPLNDRISSEQHALDLHKSKSIHVIVIRLAPWVYGRGASGVGLFMQMAAGAGKMAYIGDGSTRTTAIHVDDAARLYLLAAEKAKGGEIFNATSTTELTYKQLSEAMGGALGIPVESVSYEAQTAATGEFFARFLSTESRASSAKARTTLGWQPKEQGVIEEINSGSYKALGESLRKK